uniref:Uncharacterized protein n=1 Tax=Oryza meridionalis TaxID=40149 RepID=A0A0E0DGL0_9ORYZ
MGRREAARREQAGEKSGGGLGRVGGARRDWWPIWEKSSGGARSLAKTGCSRGRPEECGVGVGRQGRAVTEHVPLPLSSSSSQCLPSSTPPFKMPATTAAGYDGCPLRRLPPPISTPAAHHPPSLRPSPCSSFALPCAPAANSLPFNRVTTIASCSRIAAPPCSPPMGRCLPLALFRHAILLSSIPV